MIINSIQEILEIEGNTILQLHEQVNYQALDKIVDKLSVHNKNIFFTACGTSAMAAKKIVHTFNVINFPAFYLNPSDAVHGGMGSVKKGDIVFFISKGGNTKELTSFSGNIKAKGAYMVAVTENVDSILAQLSDLVIKVKVNREPDPFNMLATASTLAVIATFDAIAITVMKKNNFAEETFLLNHPSGAVGDKLKEELSK